MVTYPDALEFGTRPILGGSWSLRGRQACCTASPIMRTLSVVLRFQQQLQKASTVDTPGLEGRGVGRAPISF